MVLWLDFVAFLVALVHRCQIRLARNAIINVKSAKKIKFWLSIRWSWLWSGSSMECAVVVVARDANIVICVSGLVNAYRIWLSFRCSKIFFLDIVKFGSSFRHITWLRNRCANRLVALCLVMPSANCNSFETQEIEAPVHDSLSRVTSISMFVCL